VSEAAVTKKGINQFAVSGKLSFDTVSELMQQGTALFANASNVDIDLSSVTHADSAGLALLLEWLRYGKHNNKVVRYQNLPAQLTSLAAISEVDAMLLG
jgi:phospholipid transport system transporter-binding protein